MCFVFYLMYLLHGRVYFMTAKLWELQSRLSSNPTPYHCSFLPTSFVLYFFVIDENPGQKKRYSRKKIILCTKYFMKKKLDINNFMVLILDGNSERGAHIRSNICFFICLKHLIRSIAVANRFFFNPKKHSFFVRAQPLLSYHLI